MRETKIFGPAFFFSIVSCVIIIPAYALIKQRSSLASNGFLNLNTPTVTLLLGIVLGICVGAFVGMISGFICTFAADRGCLPIWMIASFSSLSALAIFFFFFRLLLETHPTYASVLFDGWPGLATDFIGGFLVLFVPLFLTKRYLQL